MEAPSSRNSRSAMGMSLRGLLYSLLLVYGAWFAFELSRPDVLIVGNITVDLVDGTTPTGGAVSYASVVAQALGASTCVVTVAGPEADLDVFGDEAQLYVLPANETLTFEHTYTWWGHSRRLRVTANPNITVSRAHVPWRCRMARVVLLGPLTLHDVDAASFAHHTGFWDRLLNRRQLIGLMAQGFQRDLSHDGEVLPLPEPNTRLLAGLSKRVHLFLSDVETSTWSQQDLDRVVSSAAHVIITEGEKGATLLAAAQESSSVDSSSRSRSSDSKSSSSAFQERKIPAVKVPQAVDTNGAGDTFATVYMLAAMRGDPSPGSTASWAASRAVLQPQTCKPRCAPQLITATAGGVPRLGQLERAWIAAMPLLQHLAGAAAGPVEQAAGWAAGVQVGLLDELAGWLRAFSQSSSWSRDISSRLAEGSSAGAQHVVSAATARAAAGGGDSSSSSSSSGEAAAVSID